MACMSLGRRRRFGLGGVLLATALGAGAGDVLYVNRVSVSIRNGKFAFNKIVANAVQGDALTVTGADGEFLKVRYAPPGDGGASAPAVEGYVMESALSSREVAAATAGTSGAAATVGSAGAGKGVVPLLNAGRFAQAKGLTPDPFYKMVVDSHSSVTDEAFGQFTAEGKIGPHKANPSASTRRSVQ